MRRRPGDRGLNDAVTPAQWDAVLQRMAVLLREDRFEDGLTQALEEVSAVLVEHFPAMDAAGASQPNPNELPDAPVLG